MRLRAGLVSVGACAALGVLAPASPAATPNPFQGIACSTSNPVTGESYGGVRICSGSAPSFDGAKLDFDLTLPEQTTGSSHPLIVMLHGFGNNKHEWESTTDEGDGADKWHWNNRWFAKHGYYVLAYTARGFRDPGRTGAYQPDTPADPSGSQDPPRGTIHLKSTEFEVRDTQWLAALVADAFANVNPNRVAVSGGSYGGGESWLQASQAQWTFPHRCTTQVPAGGTLPSDLPPQCANEGRSPPLPLLELQVAVPKYPWTDLAYSLAPGGHAGGPAANDIYETSLGTPNVGDDSRGTPKALPFGTPKFSFIEGLYLLGESRGQFEEGTAPGERECAYSATAWKSRVDSGDSYDTVLPPPKPPCLPATTSPPPADVPQIRRGLARFRSSYYQDDDWERQAARREVAVYSIQGWTDDLFGAIESFRQFKYLKRLDPLWPVEVAVADVGHQRAQNNPLTWHHLNAQAWQFLQSNIQGSNRQSTNVSSEPTICPSADEPAQNFTADQRLTAKTPEALSPGTLTVQYRPGRTTSPPGIVDPKGPATDPVLAGNKCTVVPEPLPLPEDVITYSRLSEPLRDDKIYVGLGSVEVPYKLNPDTTPTATLHARIWDRGPSGQERLVTRGTYRLFNQAGYDSSTGKLVLPLFGNHWQLHPRHRIRLDLTQVDKPFFRASNFASEIEFPTGPILKLPTRQATDLVLQEAP
jgi:hypothetical protein